MTITELRIDGIRNLRDIDMYPMAGTNIIYGDNAQGKTNLLEAIFIMSGQKSFRGARDKELLGFGRQSGKIELRYCDSVRSQTISLELGKTPKDKRFFKNGVPLKSASELIGSLYTVVFTPEDLQLTRGSPEVRRSFLDRTISLIHPMYSRILAKYDKILEQRNAALKVMDKKSLNEGQLDIWDEQLSRMGAYMSVFRAVSVSKLQEAAGSMYKRLSGEKEELKISYYSTVFDKIPSELEVKDGKLMALDYHKRLLSSRKEDLRLGYTQLGVHRDDLIIELDGLSVKDYGSQGQNRSCALCLKLAEAELIKKEKKEFPVILLDDVMSELDSDRRFFVKRAIEGAQIFITCCDEPKAKRGCHLMSGGRLKRDF